MINMANRNIELALPIQHSMLCVDRTSILVGSAGGAVTQSLGIAAREDELHRAEEADVKDLFLIDDQLANTGGHFHRAAFEFDHADGDTV